MVKTGRLEIDHNTDTSRLNAGAGDRKRLARTAGTGDPFTNATAFLEDERGLSDGESIFVVGEDGTHSGVAVIFITDAGRAVDAIEVISTSATKLAATTKSAARKRTRKSTKKTSKKRSRKSGKESKKK